MSEPVTIRGWRDAVLFDRALDRTTTVVAMILASDADRVGPEVAPGWDRIADDLEMSVKTVGRAIRRLTDAGYIVQTHKGHNCGYGESVSTTYRLFIPSET